MIYFQLAFEFFKIGLFSFGGGYATLPFLYHISQEFGWYTLDELTQMETPRGNRRDSSDIKARVSKMIEELDAIIAAPVAKTEEDETMNIKDVKAKVDSFKEKLININWF